MRRYARGREVEERRNEMESDRGKHGDFAEGERTEPPDEREGSFAEGEETRPREPHEGSFAEGEETEPHEREGSYGDRDD
jgi:hypothetical protein